MSNDKIISQPEKEEIRLQLLASMLVYSNRNYFKQSNGIKLNFWRDLLKKNKIF
jgi:hypothetical protein